MAKGTAVYAQPEFTNTNDYIATGKAEDKEYKYSMEDSPPAAGNQPYIGERISQMMGEVKSAQKAEADEFARSFGHSNWIDMMVYEAERGGYTYNKFISGERDYKAEMEYVAKKFGHESWAAMLAYENKEDQLPTEEDFYDDGKQFPAFNRFIGISGLVIVPPEMGKMIDQFQYYALYVYPEMETTDSALAEYKRVLDYYGFIYCGEIEQWEAVYKKGKFTIRISRKVVEGKTTVGVETVIIQ